MAKFDLEKYWDFRVWVKSQIAQLRALLSEYQQNGGGGGTGGGGGGDFDPNGFYPNMSVGTATKATSATTAESAKTATTADSATHADSADSATIANSAMKAEYATNAENAERAKIANSAESAKSAASASTAALAINLQNAPELTTNNEQIVVKVGNKTSNALTVPYAQRADFATDLSGRVEATPEVFTYRPSAGDKSIKDDNAFIRSIKGNSVVWNQLAHGGVYSNTQVMFGLTCSQTFDSRELKVTGTYIPGSASADYNWYGAAALTNRTVGIVGHKYLCHISGNKECSLTLYGWCSISTNIYDAVIKECTSSQQLTMAIRLPQHLSAGTTVDETIIIDIHDLTAMFGTGNEPTTVEEFRALYPNSYYPYNAGELRNLVCSGIKTVGFNEFNGTYARVLPNESYYLGGSYTSIGFAKELGGATETISIPSNRIYTPTQLGYIYATGTDICINLHHTGYRDGEYEPYKEVTHSLPLSKITNGEPLRKAGSVYDEINETEYIRRVGVRGYATGDKDDATLLTDGRYTNYPLDEPIVTPIETPIDFNYYVEDFGTEEALLADDSAPFSADIIYQFNATDQVRNNARNIQRLKKTAFNPSGSTSQYIRGDGSYGDVSELSRVIPIYDGEMDSPDGSDYDYEFRLFPQQYAKSKVVLDGDSKVLIRIEVPDNASIVGEYRFELEIGETIPQIRFESSNDEEIAAFCINGEIETYAVNIWHIITTDGGSTFVGEIKNYVF